MPDLGVVQGELKKKEDQIEGIRKKRLEKEQAIHLKCKFTCYVEQKIVAEEN